MAVVVQLLFATPWTAAHQAPLSFTISWSLLRLMSIESVMSFNHLIPCCPLLFLPSIFPSIRVFSSESALRIRWQNYWSFSYSISPSNEYSVLISLRVGWFDLLAVQGTHKSFLQLCNLKVYGHGWHFFSCDLTISPSSSCCLLLSVTSLLLPPSYDTNDCI